MAASLRMGSKLFQVQHYWIRSNCQWLTSRAPGALCECTKKTCLHCVEISLYCYSCACLQWKRRILFITYVPLCLFKLHFPLISWYFLFPLSKLIFPCSCHFQFTSHSVCVSLPFTFPFSFVFFSFCRTPLCHFLPTSLVLSPTKPASGMSKSSVQIDMESICGLTVQELSKVTSHGLFFFFLLINRSADPFMSPFFFFSL
ncbi:uncharacterized protein LOC128340628 isoform X2 [Hemicordylus capensis]|uniref:uncharacterized protein LOC128340628 isoform X2 n=1 Tax=Hemicordylus capensis TaxID=884348 RepID=UPI0023031D42|nr:uncharacterized protein LOC128340628 isoform X2 [Hemicordylus capensis]